MKDIITEKRHSEYNNIIKESDDLYRNATRELGLSECAFWILYVLRVEKSELTQSEICSYLYEPKQTVNSALKKLETEGYIELYYGNDRRSKQIRLTKKGMELSNRTADRVIEAEYRALLGMTDEEQETFINLFRKYTDLLKEQMRDL